MDADLKARWIAALRSGYYKQETGALRKNGGFCCLGVLCDVVDPNGWTENDLFHYGNRATSACLPVRMNEAIGLPEAFEADLTTMNDRHRNSFADIANWIEANV